MKMKKYKLIADFPNRESFNIKKVGDVFSDDGKTAVRDQNGRAIFAIDWDKYPHLFKKL